MLQINQTSFQAHHYVTVFSKIVTQISWLFQCLIFLTGTLLDQFSVLIKVYFQLDVVLNMSDTINNKATVVGRQTSQPPHFLRLVYKIILGSVTDVPGFKKSNHPTWSKVSPDTAPVGWASCVDTVMYRQTQWKWSVFFFFFFQNLFYSLHKKNKNKMGGKLKKRKGKKKPLQTSSSYLATIIKQISIANRAMISSLLASESWRYVKISVSSSVGCWKVFLSLVKCDKALCGGVEVSSSTSFGLTEECEAGVGASHQI